MTGVVLGVQIRHQEAVAEVLRQLSGPQARAAYAKALDDAGFQARRVMQREIGGAFDRVTLFIRNAPKVFRASPDKLSVAVAPTLHTDRAYQQDVLQAQEFGGRRADKRSEVALRRAGILPNGFQTALPATPYPGSDDGRGNIRGAFVAQLISYLQASAEQGYRANMTDKRRRQIHKGSANAAGRRYFVSYGRLRGQHLAMGIWAAMGTHGSDVRPVLMFVRRPTYQPRISMERIAQQADLQEYLDRRVRFRLREALGV